MGSKVRRQIGEGFWLQPKFYKIILSQHECNSLRIPEDFVRRYCKNMLNPLYLEVPSGQVWEVEVENSQGQIWLAKGWHDFCEYYSISCGHFLMFGYNARSHFNVTIFNLSATEIKHPYSIHIFHCHETHHAPKSDLSELDDSVDIIEGVQRRPKLKEKIPESNEDCRMHKQQSKSVYDQNKTVIDKESTTAYQKAKAFKSKNPFIISFIQPSYVFTPFNLSIALKFARKHFLENDANLVLRVPGSGPWSVKCTFGIANAKVGSGWKAFVLDNKLKVGDVCVFEVIKGAQLFVDVTIFRAVGIAPMHNIVGEEPGDSDSKRKVIKTNNSVPCSQPKVVQTKKLKHQAGSSYGLNSKIREEHVRDTEIEHSVKILGHCPLGHGSKRKRPKGEAEDDASIDVHTKSLKVEMSQDDVASPSFTRKSKKSGESCRMRKQQTEMVYAKKMTVLDKERTIAYQRAKAFKSKNPFVIYFMQPSYVAKPYNLNISFLIAWKCFREKCGNLVLHVRGGDLGPLNMIWGCQNRGFASLGRHLCWTIR